LEEPWRREEEKLLKEKEWREARRGSKEENREQGAGSRNGAEERRTEERRDNADTEFARQRTPWPKDHRANLPAS
jgi:hypothetical protein